MRTDRKCGGVSMYVKSTYKSSKISQCSGIYDHFEACTVEVNINTNFSIFIIGVYRPPNTSISEFLCSFESFLTDNFEPSNNLFFMGDFNIDISPDSSNGCELIELFGCHDIRSLINKPTRITNTSCTIIDHVWTNIEIEPRSGVIICDVSDHFIVFTSFLSPYKRNKIKKSFRDHSITALDGFKSSFATYAVDFYGTLDGENLDNCISSFNGSILDIYNEHCPIRTKSVSINARKPWLTPDILRMIKFKQYLFNEYKKNYIPFYIYNNFKNKMCNITKKAKNSYIRGEFQNCMGNTAKTWRNINTFYRNDADSSNQIQLKENDALLKNGYDVAETFNTYFSTVAQDMDNNMPISNVPPISFMSHPVPESFSINLCTSSEVQNVIEKFENKTCPLNQVPIFIYKQVIRPLSSIISSLFNYSISDGYFPSSLKVARIRPLHKGGDSKLKNHYRPISILSFISKVFEKLMYIRISCFLTDNDILCSHQFGFRSGLSTSDAIVEYLDCVYKSIDRNNVFFTLFLDFRRAFDTVNHDILLLKLFHYGVRGVAHEWFRSYLLDRNQYVEIDGAKSSYARMNLGVPQGAVLGPLLFLIYINDMYMSCKNLKFIHYADDTTAFISGPNHNDVIAIINEDLDRLYIWLQSNRLTLNANKSSFMIHGHFNGLNSINISIRNERLTQTSTAKFLGITIDEKLNFREHIQNVICKVGRVSGLIWRIKGTVPRKILRLMYQSLAGSQLSYGILAWGGGNITEFKRLQAVQNRIIRNIYGSSSPSMYQSNKILPLIEIFNFFASIKLYNEINCTNDHSYFNERVQNLQNNHSHDTRFVNNNNINVPFFTRARGHSSFLYKSIRFWNNLPPDIKNIPSIGSFKNKIKLHLLDQLSLSV